MDSLQHVHHVMVQLLTWGMDWYCPWRFPFSTYDPELNQSELFPDTVDVIKENMTNTSVSGDATTIRLKEPVITAWFTWCSNLSSASSWWLWRHGTYSGCPRININAFPNIVMWTSKESNLWTVDVILSGFDYPFREEFFRADFVPSACPESTVRSNTEVASERGPE